MAVSVASIIFIISGWYIVIPVLSVILYYPRVARTLYRQSKEIDYFLQGSQSVTRTNYIRILLLASISIFLVLAYNVTIFVLTVVPTFETNGQPLPFYQGWDALHGVWSPGSFSWEEARHDGGGKYMDLNRWASFLHSCVIFGLFGLTAGARASYWNAFCIAAGWFGWRPAWRAWGGTSRSALSSIRFSHDGPPQDISISLASAELGGLNSDNGIAPSSPDRADVESKDQPRNAMPEIDEFKSSARHLSDIDSGGTGHVSCAHRRLGYD
ncbi:hypothetical protein PENSPDRAFT_684047 [Peniophora sp. CONT]|nr:hypothetical protein PENSPDRAFT_684047 [Peniophora sp. CONT]